MASSDSKKKKKKGRKKERQKLEQKQKRKDQVQAKVVITCHLYLELLNDECMVASEYSLSYLSDNFVLNDLFAES
ncbi:hypothetical protein BLOT_013163 [Blomia tropicalis]|nr:hypothetical protein BLOT_013163 [Blomia tropicalis]